MPPPRRSARQVKEMIEDPRLALSDPEYWTGPVCKRWLDHVADSVHFDSAKALRLAIVGVRHALRVVRRGKQTRIRHYGILARAYGVLGSVYRANGYFVKAGRTLDKAERLARSSSDPDVLSDILRRRALLRAYQAHLSDGTFDPDGLCEAVELGERAVALARGPSASAKAKLVRGLLRIRTGRTREAAEDARWALGRIDSDERPYDHMFALSVLISALTKGNKEDREEAAGHMEQLRLELPPRTPILRARYEWAEALLLFANRQRKMRARRRLDHARRTFVRRKMVPEAVAVTADLVRHKPEGTVVQFCEELLAMLDRGPVYDLVEELRSARFPDRVGIAERLREAVGGRPGLLPAPV